jgi:aquaporin Z
VTAPLSGMLLAAELRLRLSARPVRCAKLQHEGSRRCIFRCGYAR